MYDGIAYFPVRNLHPAPNNGIADFDTGKLATIPHRDIRSDFAAVELDILANVARRNDLHALGIERCAVIVTAEHIRIRVQESMSSIL